ncbi:MAG: DUF6766 family protein [Thermoanaerobaculia bacterium]
MWRNNSLSIVLALMFLASLAAHSVAGWYHFNGEQREHAQAEVSWSGFLASSEFGETLFENWESEFLQMAFYVVLTVFLKQKGSSESKKINEEEEVDEDPNDHRDDPSAPRPVRTGGWILSLYKNSLGIALVILFLVSFVGHGWAGARKFNAEHSAHGEPLHLTAIDYMRTSSFWYESFQNWQSEFLAVLGIVVLSIWLRQWGSPESKPVHAPHDATGSS